jgi:hypothetical protein
MLFDSREGESESDAIRRFTDDVMEAISNLTGQERVETYSREHRRAS